MKKYLEPFYSSLWLKNFKLRLEVLIFHLTIDINVFEAAKENFQLFQRILNRKKINKIDKKQKIKNKTKQTNPAPPKKHLTIATPTKKKKKEEK